MNRLQRYTIGKIKGIDPGTYTVNALVSDETLDRYQETILASAWTKGLKNYQKHPVLLVNHDYTDVTNQIGQAEKIWAGPDGLNATFKYFVNEGNPVADWAWKLAEKGIASFSVGFIPVEDEYPDPKSWSGDPKSLPRRIYKEVELFEISQVTIPANPNALQNALADESRVIRTVAKQIQDAFPELSGADPEPVKRDLAEIISKMGNGDVIQSIQDIIQPVAEMTARTIIDMAFIYLVEEDEPEPEEEKPADGEAVITTGLDDDRDFYDRALDKVRAKRDQKKMRELCEAVEQIRADLTGGTVQA